MGSKQPVRVLVVGAKWPLETFLERLFRHLAGNGVEITLATAVKPDESWFSNPLLRWIHLPAWPAGAAGVAVGTMMAVLTAALRAPQETLGELRRPIPGASLRQRIRSWHRLLPFAGRSWDLIYFPWNSTAISYLPLMERGTPTLVSCRGSQVNIAPHAPNRQAIRVGLGETFLRADAVHCVSEAIYQEAMTYGLDPAKTYIIRPAVDPDFFRPAAVNRKPGDRFRLLSTGTLIWTKGYEYALLAVQRLVAEGIPVHYRIVGDGQDRQRLLYAIDDLGVQDHVELCGRLAPDQVRNLLQQADAFVLSSLSEGISNAVLEAMACELPVVTTDCGGMAEAVTDGVEGFLVPVRDPVAMAGALERLARDWSLAEQIGRAGRERILRDFTLTRQADRFLELIQAATVQQGGGT